MVGVALLLTAVLSALLKKTLIQKPLVRLVITAAAVVVAFMPFEPYSLSTFMYGATGELSVTTVALLMMALLSKLLGGPLLPQGEKRLLAALVFVSGALLYPGALGFWYHDFYADGYRSGLFGYFVLAVVLVFFVCRVWKLAVLFLAAWIAWRLSLGNSSNLWDYVLDIWVFIWSLGVWIKYSLLKLRYRGAEPAADTP
jgi:hypothetical protein